jgi:hypothetical protein
MPEREEPHIVTSLIWAVDRIGPVNTQRRNGPVERASPSGEHLARPTPKSPKPPEFLGFSAPIAQLRDASAQVVLAEGEELSSNPLL